VGRSDSLSSIPPHFVAFAWRYRWLRSWLRSRRRSSAAVAGLGFLLPGYPPFRLRAEAAGPPRFLGNPIVHMPRSLTPVGLSRQAISALPFCLPSFLQRRLPRREPFGAESHGLHTRCLRFAARVTRSDTRLASGCWPGFAGRDWLPAGSQCRVSELVTSHPPCPGFAWRTRISSRSSADVGTGVRGRMV
jgi:hypothetical protein